MAKEYDPARKLYQTKITEEHVVKEIVVRLAFNKVFIWRIVERIPWGKRASTPGIPDLMGFALKKDSGGLVVPIPVFIEVKKPGGKHRPAQEEFISTAHANGCVATFAEKWEDVVAEFSRHGLPLR